MTIQMQPVKSTSISEIGYKRRTMNVTFNSGRTYEFKKVPRAIFDEFKRAMSKGAFFNQEVKESYPSCELT